MMLRDDLTRARKSAENVAARLLDSRLPPLLDKITKLEARIKKLESAPKPEAKPKGKTDGKL